MDTKYIQDFLALAEEGNSYAAAEKLYVSQSTLVRHVQALEEEFGVPLFERTRTGFVLNEAGRIFQLYAEKITLAESQCYQALHVEKETNVIKIASETNVLDVIVAFRKRFPQYTIDYYDTGNMELRLREGLMDIAFLSDIVVADNELVTLPYETEQMSLLVNEANPLADRDSVTLDDLKSERLIKLCDDPLFEEYLSDVLSSKQEYTVDTIPVLDDAFRLVDENLGVFAIHGNKPELNSWEHIRILPFDPPIEYQVFLCYRNDGYLPKAAERFVKFALNEKVKENQKKPKTQTEEEN